VGGRDRRVADSNSDDGNLAQLIADFVDADTWTESFEILLQHPELLGPAAEELIVRTIGDLSGRGEAEAAESLASDLSLLRRSREVGPEVAFREMSSESDLPDAIAAMARQLALVLGTSLQPRTATDLALALDTAQRLVQAHGLRSVTPDVQASLWDLAAAAFAAVDADGVSSDLDNAIWASKQAIALDPSLNGRQMGRIAHLSRLLAAQYEFIGDASALNEAIDCLDSVLKHAPKQATFLADRARLLWLRYQRTAGPADLAAAMLDLDSAIASTPLTHPNWAIFAADRAVLRSAQINRLGDPDEARRAVAEDTAVLGAIPAASEGRWIVLNNRSNHFWALYGLTRDPDDLRAAIDDSEHAQRLVPPGPGRLKVLSNLAVRRWSLYELKKDQGDLDGAIEAMEAVLRQTSADSPDRVSRLNNIANYCATRFGLRGDPEDRERATSAFRDACLRGLRVAPAVAFASARAWTSWAIGRRCWPEVAEAASYGQDAADRLVGVHLARADKESWLRDATGLAAEAAFAYAELGDAAKSIVAAERGRGVLLAEGLAVRSSLDRLGAEGHDDLRIAFERAAALVAISEVASIEDMGGSGITRPEIHRDFERVVATIRAQVGFEGFMRQPSTQEIRDRISQAAARGPLAYLIPAQTGGLVLTVVGEDVSVTVLPELTKAAVYAKVDSYLSAYSAYRRDHSQRQSWMDALEAITGWVWTAAVGELADRLNQNGVASLTLIPMGLLGVLPIHAAWAGKSGSRRYLLDWFSVSYAPGARCLGTAPASAESSLDSILAVEEPLPVKGPRLKAAKLEVASAVAHFQVSKVLCGGEATRESVLQNLRGHDVVHFACHGVAVADRPLASQLAMAHNEPLTVADILDCRLDGTRLAVLSACETAFPGTELVDEVVGLPAALLQSGVVGVIGSMWVVDDVATSLLISGFYERWRKQGAPVAEALRAAQKWLRDLTEEERDAATCRPRGSRKRRSGGHPYAHPYWWAAFEFHGY
jgi:CHAT domain-containing protein